MGRFIDATSAGQSGSRENPNFNLPRMSFGGSSPSRGTLKASMDLEVGLETLNVVEDVSQRNQTGRTDSERGCTEITRFADRPHTWKRGTGAAAILKHSRKAE